MQKVSIAVVCVLIAVATMALRAPTEKAPSSLRSLIARAHAHRDSASDLEIGGDLRDLPAGSTRYLAREELLAFPQVSYTVNGDPNFAGPTEISGIPLENLARALATSPESDLVIAICDDQYRAHYPSAYLHDHHPLLVLRVNGQDPDHWPKDAEGYGQNMGPYMISHQKFNPRFKIRAHEDEAQIPWGVVRVEFRDEKKVFGAIAPQGIAASNPDVQDGFRIAQQNCLRCHNMRSNGGQKAGHPWLVLSAWATASPEHFASYVRNPQSANPQAQMPPNPSYDDATLRALTAYFRTFQSPERP